MLIEPWSLNVPLIIALFMEWLQSVPWNGLLSIVFIFSFILEMGKHTEPTLEESDVFSVYIWCH